MSEWLLNKDVATLLSSFGFGMLTICLAYFNWAMLNATDENRDEVICSFREKAKIFLGIAAVSFFFSVAMQFIILLTPKPDHFQSIRDKLDVQSVRIDGVQKDLSSQKSLFSQKTDEIKNVLIKEQSSLQDISARTSAIQSSLSSLQKSIITPPSSVPEALPEH